MGSSSYRFTRSQLVRDEYLRNMEGWEITWSINMRKDWLEMVTDKKEGEIKSFVGEINPD